MFTQISSSRLVDEESLNNQRSNLFFNEYIKTKNVLNMKDVNAAEILILPNFLNWQHCKFIKFGEKSIP